MEQSPAGEGDARTQEVREWRAEERAGDVKEVEDRVPSEDRGEGRGRGRVGGTQEAGEDGGGVDAEGICRELKVKCGQHNGVKRA